MKHLILALTLFALTNEAVGAFLWIPTRMDFMGFSIVGRPTSATTLTGWLNKKSDPVAGDGYTQGTFVMHFENSEMLCELSLLFGYSDVLVVKAYGSISKCSLNNQPVDLSCAVDLTMRGQELKGPAYCNAYNQGDSYNDVTIRVRH